MNTFRRLLVILILGLMTSLQAQAVQSAYIKACMVQAGLSSANSSGTSTGTAVWDFKLTTEVGKLDQMVNGLQQFLHSPYQLNGAINFTKEQSRDVVFWLNKFRIYTGCLELYMPQ